jgi:hypothetical protein
VTPLLSSTKLLAQPPALLLVSSAPSSVQLSPSAMLRTVGNTRMTSRLSSQAQTPILSLLSPSLDSQAPCPSVTHPSPPQHPLGLTWAFRRSCRRSHTTRVCAPRLARRNPHTISAMLLILLPPESVSSSMLTSCTRMVPTAFSPAHTTLLRIIQLMLRTLDNMMAQETTTPLPIRTPTLFHRY